MVNEGAEATRTGAGTSSTVREGGTLYGIEVSHQDEKLGWVALSGEFDVSRIEELKDTLKAAAESPVETVVDLSEVTFLDLDSVREITLRQNLSPERVTFVNPSWQVLASVQACGLGDWTRFGDGRSTPALHPEPSWSLRP